MKPYTRNMARIYLATILMFVTLFVGACQRQIERQPQSSPTYSSVRTEVEVATLSPTPLPNKPIQEPTATNTSLSKPTLTPASTPISTNTSSATSLPTLTIEQSWEKVYELLHNGNCSFPCWWGIMPGETSSEAAKKIYQYIGGHYEENIVFNSQTQQEAIFLLEENAEALRLHITSLQSAELVQTIEIQSYGVKDDLFYSYWDKYSIENIIQKYGKPTDVLINPPSFGGYPSYSVWVFYNHLGAIISYDGITQPYQSSKDGKSYGKLCPELQSKQIGEIFINLKVPTDKIALSKFVPRYKTAALHLQPLENVSDLSLDEFYQLFFQNEKISCFPVLAP